MKFITGGFVGEHEAGQRLFQVAHDPRCAKSGVYWSWNGGPRGTSIKFDLRAYHSQRVEGLKQLKRVDKSLEAVVPEEAGTQSLRMINRGKSLILKLLRSSLNVPRKLLAPSGPTSRRSTVLVLRSRLLEQ